MRKRSMPCPAAREALTQTDVVILIGLAVILGIALVVWYPGLARPPRYNSVCAANLKGLGTAMYTYANENSDSLPIAAHAPATEHGKCAVTYAPGKIGTHRGNGNDPKAGETSAADTEMSVTRNLWTLVRSLLVEPKIFICPSTEDQPNTETNPQNYWDFAKGSETSYGCQVPYGTRGRPSTTCDQTMALMADKGPFGAALEAGLANPGSPTAPLPMIGAQPRWEDWAPWNSPNHAGEGQVVLYADAHAGFDTTPIVGFKKDNVYTRWSDAMRGFDGNMDTRLRGTPPTGNEAPFGDTDSLIYP